MEVKKHVFENTNEQIFTPEEYINCYENDPGSIINSMIIPPELGKPGFGRILAMIQPAKEFTESIIKLPQKEI